MSIGLLLGYLWAILLDLEFLRLFPMNYPKIMSYHCTFVHFWKRLSITFLSINSITSFAIEKGQPFLLLVFLLGKVLFVYLNLSLALLDIIKSLALRLSDIPDNDVSLDLKWINIVCLGALIGQEFTLPVGYVWFIIKCSGFQ